jgi:hypothetical protein
MCLPLQHNKDFSPKQVACPASDPDAAQAQLLPLLGQARRLAVADHSLEACCS